MRVFILCSGRTGSVSFIKACSHIKNFSSGHESRAKDFSQAKFDYPDDHIEADNRLSWFLGKLDEEFGDEAFYLVLKRNREATINSFDLRWDLPGSIIAAFGKAVLMQGKKKLDADEKKRICGLYYDTVYSNINSFIKNKSNVLHADLETIKEDFQKFWTWIGAQGDIQEALSEFDTAHNKSPKKNKWWF